MRRYAAHPQNPDDPQGAPLPDNRIAICFTRFGVDNAACDDVPGGALIPGRGPEFSA
jgi:hypothetical protein